MKPTRNDTTRTSDLPATTVSPELTEAEWELANTLLDSGVSLLGLIRLLRLRRLYRSQRNPVLDGLDAHAQFARWLVAQHRLDEGCEE
jgi:hypothetical protein